MAQTVTIGGGPVAPVQHAQTDAIGHTPLVELRRMSLGLPGRVAVKLESRNPSGSVKDRVAAALVDEQEALGLLRPGGTIVAATSGNTGLALAQIGAARNYKVRLTIPELWSHERIALMLYLGADVVITPGRRDEAGGRSGAGYRGRGAGAVLLDQFASHANPDIHRRTTAEEIWTDSAGEVDAFVAGVGTGGTITGVAQGLRAHKRNVRIVAVEPASSPVLSGGVAGRHAIQGIGAGVHPAALPVRPRERDRLRAGRGRVRLHAPPGAGRGRARRRVVRRFGRGGAHARCAAAHGRQARGLDDL